MSRAYRVRVRESISQVVRGEDSVGTTLEILEILPCESMAELLRQELLRRGFEERGEGLVRAEGGVVVEVDPASGEVTVRSELAEEYETEGELQGYADEDHGEAGLRRAEVSLREQLKQKLQDGAQAKADEVREQATARLEAELQGLRVELDQVVNRVTAEALKQKAAQIGQIKRMTENPEEGSLTIVLEV
jgi:FtsH ternary system domain X5